VLRFISEWPTPLILPQRRLPSPSVDRRIELSAGHASPGNGIRALQNVIVFDADADKRFWSTTITLSIGGLLRPNVAPALFLQFRQAGKSYWRFSDSSFRELLGNSVLQLWRALH
jgi:hypothetical protein